MPQAALDTHAEVRKLKQAGCPEEHAEAMVDLVSRAPLNAKIASRLERLESKVDIIEANMATKADLEALRADTVDRTESSRADLVDRTESLRADLVDRTESLRADLVERTESLRADLVDRTESLRVDLVDRTESLRADLTRMLWIQGLGLATLIISLAGMMLYLAGWPRT